MGRIEDPGDRVACVCDALDAVAALTGSCADLHAVPASSLASLLDILCHELRQCGKMLEQARFRQG